MDQPAATPPTSTLPRPHPLFLSEFCAACILSFTNPRTVCALACLNKTFLAASISDFVWAKLLPAHLSHVLSFADDEERSSIDSAGSKRELYFRLCQSISLRDGKQKYWLDRATGGECYVLSAKELAIVWGTSPQYWEWKPHSGSWFPKVAYLRDVCWFHVQGTFREPLKPGTYVVSFRMQLRSRPHSNGWHNTPIKLSLRNSSDGQQVDSQRFFNRQFPESDPSVGQRQDGDSLPAQRKWVECDVGLFTVEQGDENSVEVNFSMQETELLGWKSGLFLDGVLVRPFDVIPQARERVEAILRTPNPESDEGNSDDEGNPESDEEGEIAASEEEGNSDDEGNPESDEGNSDDEGNPESDEEGEIAASEEEG